jgi:hypothetical protein
MNSRTATSAIRLRAPRPDFRRTRGAIGVLAIALSAVIAAGGCSRTHYRFQADREVTGLMNEKNLPGRWGIPNFRLRYDPRSRYFDPTNPDHPPMPPDDPYSHTYMHWVDGKRGALNYHVDGDLLELENPAWRELVGTYAEQRSDGTVQVTLDGAVQIGLIHSPAYRQQVEELYLSALDVSTERFRFDAQFFGGIAPLFAHRSKNAPGAGGNSSDSLTVASDLQLQKQFAAGGELIVGLANSIVFQFAGADTNTNVSLLNFSFIQPLLRAGGRRFVMEQLTIVERNLLANLRAFERYRQGFYTNLAVGDGGTNGPQRRGGFFGGTGLTGFTGQGSGGFGEVGGATGFGRGTGNTGGGNGNAVTGGFAGGGAGTLGGYIGLLQQTQQILNQSQNLNSQQRTLRLLQANLEAGTIDIAQVDQFRQNIETSKATLLQARNGLENALETYKRQNLGLPPSLPMTLDNSMIRQFQFIDPTTNDLYERLEDFVDELGDLPVEPDVDVLRMGIDRLQRFRGETEQALAAIGVDFEGMQAAREIRIRGMSTAEATQFDADLKKTGDALDEIRLAFRDSAAVVEALRTGLAPATRRRTISDLVIAAKTLASLVQEASLVQVRARVEAITLNPVTLDMNLALEVARANRFDWMNNRAALVDTWRLIAFNARNLMSDLNITFDGSIGTQGDNPVKFRSTTGTLRAGLQFDPPFTRLLERNNYRSVLIDYQRDRRQLIQFEDSVNQSLRQSLRTLKQLEINLEIQRRAVNIATRRVDQTREVLSRPPDPVAPGAAAVGLGPTSALNLLTALNDLQSTQNNFMSVWLNHYAARMVLMRELGLMELDERGIWIDRPLEDLMPGVDLTQPEPLPPEVPQAWIDRLDGEPVPPGKAEGAAEQLPDGVLPNPVNPEQPQPPRLQQPSLPPVPQVPTPPQTRPQSSPRTMQGPALMQHPGRPVPGHASRRTQSRQAVLTKVRSDEVAAVADQATPNSVPPDAPPVPTLRQPGRPSHPTQSASKALFGTPPLP